MQTTCERGGALLTVLWFAAALGAPRRGFERDHYDIPAELHETAIAHGAELVTSRELVTRLTAAGLRRPKSRGVDSGS